MFPIALWNVYDRVKHDLPRTNNAVEAWHNQFQVSIYFFTSFLVHLNIALNCNTGLSAKSTSKFTGLDKRFSP
jgi:hypothetical protein